MSQVTIRVLGIDPGLTKTGWGVVDSTGSRVAHVAHGVIAASRDLSFASRLLHIYRQVEEVVERFGPHEAAIEETFVSVNASSTLKLGHARAAAILGVAQSGIEVSEYAARFVKKAIVGTGAAEKAQIAFMIRRLLPSAGFTTSDSADALAVAITHVHSRVGKAV